MQQTLFNNLLITNMLDCETIMQDKWQKENYAFDNTKYADKFYCLAMFPYTSGQMHMGHARTYVISDFIARLKTMQGYQVLHPIGWDSFGLPAENAANKYNLSPDIWTDQNIANMKMQLQQWGCLFNWSQEIKTSSPSYYQYTQWLFIQMYLKGLVYKKKSYVYWDPVDNTVLANEQVIDGLGWRSNAPVEKKLIEQWYIKVTHYQTELYECLNNELSQEWPSILINIQKNWIGKSTGYHVNYNLVDNDIVDTKSLVAFTTDLNSVQHGTYILIHPQHDLVNDLCVKNQALSTWLEQHVQIALKHEHDVNGSIFDTGLHVINPCNGQYMPVLISNTVADYATGVVQCSPQVSPKDKSFALAHNLPLSFNEPCYRQAQGTKQCYFKLRDWCVSRQRSWGTPLPITHCTLCGYQPIDLKYLPITVDHPELVPCSLCGEKAKRSPETLDTFFDSCWYYLRFIDPNDQEAIPRNSNAWLPVDYYIGGIEHATLHLLYARFAYKFIRDLGLVKSNEPFKKIINQGMITSQGHKMSKSKGNIVEPSTIINQYGVDCMRFFVIVTAPPKQSLEWNDIAIKGSNRFLKKCYDWLSSLDRNIWLNMKEQIDLNDHTYVNDDLGQCINNTLMNIESEAFNNVATNCIKILHMIRGLDNNHQKYKSASILLRLLHPICPHITDYFWRHIGFGPSILRAGFMYRYQNRNVEYITIKVFKNDVQIGILNVKPNTDQQTVMKLVQEQYQIINDQIQKIIYVPDKLIKIIYVKTLFT